MDSLIKEFNKYYSSLEEDFRSPLSRDSHFERHNKEFNPPFKNSEEYEQTANRFALRYTEASSAFDDSAHLVGYIAQKERYILYERYTKELVVFRMDLDNFILKANVKKPPFIISYYIPLNDDRFEKLRDGELDNEFKFQREFPHVAEQLAAKEAEERIAKQKKEAEERIAKQKDDAKKAKELKKAKYAKRFNKKV